MRAAKEQSRLVLRELREAARLDPSRADAHYRLAQVYQSMGRAADAKTEREVVMRLHEKRNDDLLQQISGKPPRLDGR